MKKEKLLIMVCDDSLLMRRKIKNCFDCPIELEIIEAKDGQHAVEEYKKNKPDIVFMDIVMPNKNGIEALKEIKEFDKEAKIIITSSSGTKSHLKEAIDLGAYDFVQKPVNPDLINKLILKIAGDDHV